jgi:chromosomal replication initiator protein
LAHRLVERVTIENVLRYVSDHYGCKIADLKSSRRNSQITKPRAVAMYLCCKLTGCSLPEIGRGFGGKHHTTVLAARDKITEQIETNRALRSEIESIQRRIQG